MLTFHVLMEGGGGGGVSDYNVMPQFLFSVKTRVTLKRIFPTFFTFCFLKTQSVFR